MPSKYDTPSGSSSEDEEEVVASQDVEEEEDEEEEEDPTPLKPSKPNPTSNFTPQKQPQPPSDDESDSDSDSPTPTKTQTPAPLDIKPISSKPMTPSSTKPQRPTVVGLPSSTKRPAETDEKDSRKDKKKKKKVADLVNEDKKTADDQNDQKKNLFQRLWTEDDEIVILKGMISFKNKGMDVNSHLSAFVDTIKDSLHINDVSKTQVHSKIRALKRKFQNAAKKAKPGEDPGNLKPHDAKLYQLSKKIWSEEIVKDEEDAGKNLGGDDKKGKSKKIPDGVASSPNPRVTTLPNNTTATTKVVVKDDDKKSSSEYFYLSESSIVPNYPMMPVPPLGLGDIVSKRGWDVIGSSKAQKFDQRWKNVIIAETKAYLQRLDLVKEQTQAMLDALESSNV